ncbi:Uncharacterised protein [uncultured archaeon]|nr:Uncharacterised protein [uncultured archaeon]
MRKTIGILLFLVVIASGCLDTKAAWPAIVADNVLNEEGWSAAGVPQMQSQTQTVAGVKFRINLASMNYRDDGLAVNISNQVQEFTQLTPGEASSASKFTSQLITVRLVLPAGISLPSELMNQITASKIEQMASQNNIKDFHETNSTKTTLSGGKEIELKNYEGLIDFEGVTIKVKGMLASWPDKGSDIIVLGVLPAEDIVITPASGNPETIKINSGEESRKMIRLIQNVK